MQERRAIKLGGHWLRGVIRFGDQVGVVDYKTGKTLAEGTREEVITYFLPAASQENKERELAELWEEQRTIDQAKPWQVSWASTTEWCDSHRRWRAQPLHDVALTVDPRRPANPWFVTVCVALWLLGLTFAALIVGHH